MRKRLFFIVKQLNKISSQELTAVSFSAYLNEEYDVFLYSIEKIIDNKINGVYEVNPRVTIRSLDLPINDNEKNNYVKNNTQLLKDTLAMSSRENDIFVMFDSLVATLVPSNTKKILIEGFVKNDNYDLFDKVIFLTREEYNQKCLELTLQKDKFAYIIPYSRFDHDEDFKFHGNKILTVTRFEESRNHDNLFTYIKGLKESGLKFIVSICGEGENDLNIEKGIKEYGIENYVEIVSNKYLQRLFKEGDLLFYLEEDEIYPQYLVESIAFSVPVLSYSENRYSKEILKDVGIYALSINDAIEKTVKLLNDKIKLSKLKFETFEHARGFNKLQAIKKLISIFEN